jgi:thiamine-monophosphate kinase
MKIKELGEFRFIDRVKQGCLMRPEGVVKAIDDDCCVFRTPERKVNLLTTDMLVEDVHFLRDAIPPFTLGRKSIAVNISDIAAMGGEPGEAVISLAVPQTVEVDYLDEFYEGMRSMCREFHVNILGGDTTSSPQHLVINIALTGWAAEDEVLYRDGARPGDIVFLAGHVGSSAAGLDIVLAKRDFAGKQELLDAHFDPRPQVREGRIIAGLKAAHSMIDVSDGVASDLGHICRQSGVGAVLDWENIPVTETFRRYCAEFRSDSEKLALHVGEDYVLLGTHPEKSAARLKSALETEGCKYFSIGRIVEGPGIRLKMADGALKSIEARGYDHFRK